MLDLYFKRSFKYFGKKKKSNCIVNFKNIHNISFIVFFIKNRESYLKKIGKLKIIKENFAFILKKKIHTFHKLHYFYAVRQIALTT